MAQAGDGREVFVADRELLDRRIDGPGRLVHYPAVRGNQHIGAEPLDFFETVDQLGTGPHEGMIPHDLEIPALESPLNAVDVPDLSFVVNQVTGKDRGFSVDLDEVT